MDYYPLKFEPILKTRVWGGRNLESLYNKTLPSPDPYGESWEISDRHEGVSRIINGEFRGRDLRWLMEHHGQAVMGYPVGPDFQFPLLVKILDAQDRLSLQVHPPESKAAELKGEPKTEMWFIAQATEGACIYAGLKSGVQRKDFESQCAGGTVEKCFHKILVQPGDAMFLPSGRVHAIGAGNVIFEIQQNSDTTYRVFDWNRKGLDGQPRALHLNESLQCIDFNDIEPDLIQAEYELHQGHKIRPLVRDVLFSVDDISTETQSSFRIDTKGHPLILGLIRGQIEVAVEGGACDIQAGEFCLIPACSGYVSVLPFKTSRMLCASPRLSRRY